MEASISRPGQWPLRDDAEEIRRLKDAKKSCSRISVYRKPVMFPPFAMTAALQLQRG